MPPPSAIAALPSVEPSSRGSVPKSRRWSSSRRAESRSRAPLPVRRRGVESGRPQGRRKPTTPARCDRPGTTTRDEGGTRRDERAPRRRSRRASMDLFQRWEDRRSRGAAEGYALGRRLGMCPSRAQSRQSCVTRRPRLAPDKTISNVADDSASDAVASGPFGFVELLVGALDQRRGVVGFDAGGRRPPRR